jgi:hypothetical protein
MKKALRQIVLWVVAALAVAICADAAASDVVQCKDASGKITFSNIPCSGQTPKPESIETSAYSTPYGEWLGQIQFKEASAKGAAAKAVAALTIKIESGGRLTGASNETGCRALGIAAPSVTPMLLSLDVTLSNCLDAGFNRHYNGSLAVYPAEKSAQLMLMSTPMPAINPPPVYDLRGTMRR